MSLDAAFDDADLNGYVDGRIEPARAAALAESLASDHESRARIEGWKRQNESLRTMFASVLFEPVPVRLLPTAIPAAIAPVPAGQPRDAGRGRLVGVVAVVAVGMGLIGFAVGALTSAGSAVLALGTRWADGGEAEVDAGGDGDLAARAAETHRTYLADALRPVEITVAEEPKLLRWIQHRLGAPVRLPDLQRQGWGLVGGRVVPGRRGPAAFLVYGSGADRLALTLSRDAAPGEGGLSTVSDGTPVGVATWREGGFAYALSTDRGAPWLGRNAEALRSAVMSQVRGSGTPP